jgi:ATP-binding cassette subfamily B protein
MVNDQPARSIYRRLVRHTRPYATHIGLLFLLELAAAPLNLLGPLPLKIAVDNVLGSQPLPHEVAAFVPDSFAQSRELLLYLAVGLTIATGVVIKLHWVVTSVLRTYTGDRLVREFRGRLFRHLQRLSIRYHDSRGSSDSLYRLQYDAMALQYISIDCAIPFVTSLLTVVGMIVITFRLDFQLAAVALTATPLLMAITIGFRGRLRRHSKQVKDLETGSMSVLQEVLGAIRVVKAFTREDSETGRYNKRSNETIRARIHLTIVEGVYGLLLGLAITCGTAAALFVGVRHVQAGTLSLGSLLLVMAYLAQLYAPIKTLTKKTGSLQSHLASMERVFTILDEQPDVPEVPSAHPLRRAAGHIVLEKISFAYDPGHPVLKDLSFDVRPGMRVGIAGETGAGKTTLASLLMRFYDPQQGRILLDGRDIREYKVEDLRNQFSVVLQEPVLFAATIAENIAYGRAGANLQEIIAAAEAANAHQFITGLPNGYDTFVGERGMRLSGGERQRIGLARAFLRNAPILILDEPTSSVDVRTEESIMAAMQALMAGKTTFMIAHRTSTFEHFDTVLRIENGCLLDPNTARFETATGAA